MEDTQSPSQEESTPIEHVRLLEWWEQLDSHRGDRAALRRASGIDTVMFNPSFHWLWRNLKDTRWQRPERVALIAALTARARENDPSRSFAAQLGTPPMGREKAALSGLRFRRLLQASDANALLQSCSRAIALCNNRVNIPDMAKDVYWWNNDVRKRWAFHYYDANSSGK